MSKKSTVTIRGKKDPKTVNIASDSKPEIGSSLIEKWQTLIDTVAKIVDVPSGLIMRLNEDNIEVFLKSNTDKNPYEEGEKVELVYGLYCETVIGTQIELLVPDATKSPIWNHDNPDIDINMISYLGMPLNWPDGECFGTVCLLDNKENHYSQDFKNLLRQVRSLVETDLKLLMQAHALEEKNDQLEQLNEVKTKFLSLISHDVRGSISSVKMFLDLVISDIDNSDKTKLEKLLRKIRNNIISSHETLEDLLMWSKNDLVHLQPDINPVNIVDIIQDILRGFKEAIELKNITVDTDFYAEEIFVSADQKMMKVILRNLISNAVKYNDNHGEIKIRVDKKGEDHRIEVEDNGIGMSQATIDNLFTFDKDNNSSGTAGESSAGIGLILVKDFADKNNASISVSSTKGKGSVFSLNI